MMIPTFSGLTVTDGHNEEIRMVNGEVFKFNYCECFAYHYKYRVTVDNPNSLSHNDCTKFQIGLESAWGTTW